VKERERLRAEEFFGEVEQEERKVVKGKGQVLGKRARRGGSLAATSSRFSSKVPEAKQSRPSKSSFLASLSSRGPLDELTGQPIDSPQVAPPSRDEWGLPGPGDEDDMDYGSEDYD